ncbi:hypothetical protein A2Z56_00785 [Candidatus Kaiserbacteria bacterium RIFCSPHIGHO2_12_45_16]|nr:MAG: hypothetical protein A2Z56_00785 [Candidatus Kaiserbacteria bacterium RIFCSPHIGHO2_12_45_16]
MIEFLIALLVVGLFAWPKLVKLLPRQATPATPAAQTGAGNPPAPAAPSTPVSKRVKWIVGGVIGILILALIWQALPTVSTPEQVASVSWFYNLMSYLDVSNTTFGKPVAELVGVTLAPFVLAIAAVALAVAVFYLVHWGGGVMVAFAVVLMLAIGFYWGLKAYVQGDTSSRPVPVDFRRANVGETVTVRMELMTTAVVKLRMAIKGRDNGVFWACPITITPAKLPFAPKFKVAAGAYNTENHIVLTQASKAELIENGTTAIEVTFQLAVAPDNPCANLL